MTKRAKQIIISIISILGLLILFFIGGYFIGRGIKNSQTTKVAFYGLPESVTTALQQEISTYKAEKITFTILDANTPLSSDILSDYTLLFTWNGKTVNNLAAKAIEIPKKYYELLPTTIGNTGIQDSKHFCMPILLDHFEIAYYKTFRKQASLEIPETYDQLVTYLQTLKETAQYPLIVAGKDDFTLISFVGTMYEALFGAQAYSNLVNSISTSISATNDSCTLPSELLPLLDTIKELQSSGLIHPKWTVAKENDINNFMADHLISAVCQTLSTHRTQNLLLVMHYDSSYFPAADTSIIHGVIAPEVCGLALKDKNSEVEILCNLIDINVQQRLTDATQLAPVNARTPAYDMQSDDVRFWAAASPAGPLPDLATAAFSNPKDKEKLAQLIRDYLDK